MELSFCFLNLLLLCVCVCVFCSGGFLAFVFADARGKEGR